MYKKINVNHLKCLVKFMSTKSKNHYDSLGISKTSTQNEIKSAYYKLSMQYHPDKNPSDTDCSKKFRDITEAYEVLGNVKTRKMYDKGLYMRPMHGPIMEEEPTDKFHKSREVRSRPPPPDGRTPIYDFDEWSRSHYGATFKKQQMNRENMRVYQMQRQRHKEDVKVERVMFFFGIIFLLCMLFSADYNYDKVRVTNNKNMLKKNQSVEES